MSKSLSLLLGDLHESLTKELIERINSGEGTAADFREARELLKQNQITADSSNAALEALKASMGNQSTFEEDMANDFTTN